MSDDEIDTSDIPPLDETFFANAKPRMPKGKVPAVISVDAEVVEWFKAQGGEYQS
ncbi:MAG TPA: BrnA antitoxin family protein [Blastocatellia bacterium]|nr:BrnA antitoxin family protein [Blastocatellia bacterium]